MAYWWNDKPAAHTLIYPSQTKQTTCVISGQLIAATSEATEHANAIIPNNVTGIKTKLL